MGKRATAKKKTPFACSRAENAFLRTTTQHHRDMSSQYVRYTVKGGKPTRGKIVKLSIASPPASRSPRTARTPPRSRLQVPWTARPRAPCGRGRRPRAVPSPVAQPHAERLRGHIGGGAVHTRCRRRQRAHRLHARGEASVRRRARVQSLSAEERRRRVLRGLPCARQARGRTRGRLAYWGPNGRFVLRGHREKVFFALFLFLFFNSPIL